MVALYDLVDHVLNSQALVNVALLLVLVEHLVKYVASFLVFDPI